MAHYSDKIVLLEAEGKVLSSQKRGKSYKGKNSHSQSSYVKVEPKTGNGESDSRERIFLPCNLNFTKSRHLLGSNCSLWGRVALDYVKVDGNLTKKDMDLDCRLHRYAHLVAPRGQGGSLKASDPRTAEKQSSNLEISPENSILSRC